MKLDSKIFVAGHRGLVGSAIVKVLQTKGYDNLVLRSSAELDLRNQQATRKFFEQEKPEFVVLAAAKVGGIVANNTYRADFIYDNLQIQNNVIHFSYEFGVKKLLFLGSTCIYPAADEGRLLADFAFGIYERALCGCKDCGNQDVRAAYNLQNLFGEVAF